MLDLPLVPPPVEGIGTTIAGRYAPVELIGEGGMGSVYLARQSEPVRREVALKLIKRGMDSRAVLARFEAERQALALMDHPNIARVFDGGTTATGRPFFVMEYVRGEPITRFCDGRRLGPVARLELFAKVCRAVQHAHQKGIIHRDLKPGNVLVVEVDGRPEPKVIDFGVAKAIEQPLTDHSLGDTGSIVGTPTYMSPEQADPSSMDIDTRTDVYALGVLLYELLTGSPPIDPAQFMRGAVLEMLRMVREVDPPRPSTRLSSSESRPDIAACRGVEPADLVRWLRGDVDWIVMKALEKDRERRYDSANGLAADIDRFLAFEPVIARPPSRGYRLRKFIRRHRAGVIAASMVLLALVLGIVGTTLGLIEARAQRELAEQQRGLALAEAEAREQARLAEAEQRALAEQANRQAFDALKSFTDELMTRLIGSRDTLTEVERSVLLKAQQQWEVFARSKGSSPEARDIRAEGAKELASLQLRLGMIEEAERNDRLALDLWAGLSADFPAEPSYRFKRGIGLLNLGVSQRGNGRNADGEASYREAIEVFEGLARDFPDDPDYRRRQARILVNLGNATRARDALEEAEGHYRRALAILEGLADDGQGVSRDRFDRASGHWNLAYTLRRSGRTGDSEAEYRIALDLLRGLAAEDPAEPMYRADLASLGRELGVLLYDDGQLERGEAVFPEVIETLGDLADEFPSIPAYRLDLSRCRTDYGRVLGFLDRQAEAAGQFLEAARLAEGFVADSPTVHSYRHALGLAYAYHAEMLMTGDDPAESLPWHEKGIRALSAALELDPRSFLSKNALGKAHARLAETLETLGREAEAAPEWDLAVELGTEETLQPHRALRALNRARQGRFDEALAELEEVTRAEPEDPVHSFNFARALALAAADSDDDDRRDDLASRAVEQLRFAVDAGFADADRLDQEPDLDVLRGRDDFDRLRPASTPGPPG